MAVGPGGRTETRQYRNSVNIDHLLYISTLVILLSNFSLVSIDQLLHVVLPPYLASGNYLSRLNFYKVDFFISHVWMVVWYIPFGSYYSLHKYL